jgi:hypothetical protein
MRAELACLKSRNNAMDAWGCGSNERDVHDDTFGRCELDSCMNPILIMGILTYFSRIARGKLSPREVMLGSNHQYFVSRA